MNDRMNSNFYLKQRLVIWKILLDEKLLLRKTMELLLRIVDVMNFLTNLSATKTLKMIKLCALPPQLIVLLRCVQNKLRARNHALRKKRKARKNATNKNNTTITFIFNQ